jgi:hypothetical protein
MKKFFSLAFLSAMFLFGCSADGLFEGVDNGAPSIRLPSSQSSAPITPSSSSVGVSSSSSEGVSSSSSEGVSSSSSEDDVSSSSSLEDMPSSSSVGDELPV